MIAFGIIMVLSASSPYAASTYGDSLYFFERDVAFGLLGIVVMVFVSFIPFRWYEKHAHIFFFLACVLGVLVLIPGIGRLLNNARRWIGVGTFSIMPSDFLKMGSIFLLAKVLSHGGTQKNRTLKIFLVAMAIIAVPAVLIFLQPDFSTLLVTVGALLLVFFVGGMNLTHTIGVGALGVAGLAFAFFGPGSGMRRERVLAFLDPLANKQDSGWQLVQSLYAVSSGGLFGVGLGQGRQKFDYLAAEPHNDFIFAVISEELGFVGAMFVIAMYLYFIYRGVRIAQHAQSDFAKLVAYGLTFVIALQAMVNIGVSIGLVPPTGITLPFISYGGSSLVASCMMIGILLNISRPRADS